MNNTASESTLPPLPVGVEFDPVIRQERDRCLAAIRQTDEGGKRIALYAATLDDFIQWSLAHEELVHSTHHRTAAAQDTFKFVLRGSEQVFWEMAPDRAEGAKLSALPKTTADLPEEVRAEVRRRWGAIDRRPEIAGRGEARLWVRFLFHEDRRRDAQAALEWALENRVRADQTS
jgi:hypothetical protein